MATIPIKASLPLLLASLCVAQDREARGVWMTPRVPTGFSTPAELAGSIETAAKARFNTIYFDCYSRGWPLWRSKAFERETGYATDPAAGERDLLLEATIEAHRHGIELVAWFEGGFVGWWDGQGLEGRPNGPLLAKHADWITKSSAGIDRFPNASSGSDVWLAHANPKVQDFLIRLCEEVATQHDVDGIELDHVAYPDLDCGYDPVTLARWKGEHGAETPKAPGDPKWMRMRADVLSRFVTEASRAVRTANPRAVLSVVVAQPGPEKGYVAYDRFLQDWHAWLNGGHVDGVELRIHANPAEIRRTLTAMLEGMPQETRKKLRAAVMPRTTDYTLSGDETVDAIESLRKIGLSGHVLWTWLEASEPRLLDTLQRKGHPGEALLPWRDGRYRRPGIVLDEKKQKRPDGWKEAEIRGAFGGSLLATDPRDKKDAKPIEYVADVPEDGLYQVYAWHPGAEVALHAPRYTLHGAGEPWQVRPSGQDPAPRAPSWVPIGHLRLVKGERQRVVSASPADLLQDAATGSDALLLLVDRRIALAAREGAGPKR